MIRIERLFETGVECASCGSAPNYMFKIQADPKSPVIDAHALYLCPTCKFILTCRLNWYPDGKP